MSDKIITDVQTEQSRIPLINENNTILKDDCSQHYGTPVQVKTPEAFRNMKSQITVNNKKAMKKLMKASCLTTIFVIVQLTGAIIAGSIALLADTAHLATDLVGFSISVISLKIAQKPASIGLSYGYHRAEVLGTLISMLVLWTITVFLVYAATLRFINPPVVKGDIMFATAVLGLIFNLIQMSILDSDDTPDKIEQEEQLLSIQELNQNKDFVLNIDKLNSNQLNVIKSSNGSRKNSKVGDMENTNLTEGLISNGGNINKEDHDKKQLMSMSSSFLESPFPRVNNDDEEDTKKKSSNLNVESAYLHVLGDMLMSVGVIVAAIIIFVWPSAVIADPICTYLFSVIVGFTSFPVVNECIKVLMEGTPHTFDIEELKNDILSIKGVSEIHDFHLWSVSIGKYSLSCHIKSDKPFKTLSLVTDLCRRKYNIYHTTIQMELHSMKDYHFNCKNELHD